MALLLTEISDGRAASLTNLRVGQPKGTMWPLLRCDDMKSFQIGTKISHMVTCIGSVLYSEESLFFYSPSLLYMIDCLVKSNETYFPETHDSMYSLEDDWVTPPSLP